MKEDQTPEVVETPAIELSVVFGNESGLFSITPDGMRMELQEDISFDQYRLILQVLKNAKTKSTIWLADAIRFGNKKFGADLVNTALEQLEFDMPVVRSAIAIESVPPELRLPNITADHLVELSKAESKKDKVKWARLASEHNLTPVQLRFSIAENEIVDRAASRQLATGVVTIQGIRQSFEIWRMRVGGIDGVLKMEDDDQSAIIGELQEIADFCNQLQGRINAVDAQ